MKTRIEQLLEEIGTLMQGHLSKRDFQSVTHLSTLLARLQSLQKRATELDGEISEIETTIGALNGKTTPQKVAEIVPQLVHTNGDSEDFGRTGPQTLRIEVDWKANGKTHEKELILLPKAGDGVVKFLSRVIEEFGPDALQKLSRVKINRGLLLSKTPATDFLNQAQGKVYAHKRLRGTDYYVLTHSQTSQKMDDIIRICRVLGFVPGSVQVRTVSRADCYAEIYA
jgi:hypothetical protein